MSIQGKLARVIEANRIGGVKTYGEYEYREEDPRMKRTFKTISDPKASAAEPILAPTAS